MKRRKSTTRVTRGLIASVGLLVAIVLNQMSGPQSPFSGLHSRQQVFAQGDSPPTAAPNVPEAGSLAPQLVDAAQVTRTVFLPSVLHAGAVGPSPSPTPGPQPTPGPSPTPGPQPTPGPSPTPQPTPPVGNLVRWSDPATWGGAVPKAGDAVTIPGNKAVLLDVSPPPLKSLTIEGQLVFDDNQDLNLTAGWIMAHGSAGLLQIGAESKPYLKKATITLTGPASKDDAMGMGAKFLGAMMGGTLYLNGEPRATTWTKLATTAAAGATSITLVASADWRAGDRIVLAPTGMNPTEAETATVRSVAGAQVQLEQPLRFRHFAGIDTINGMSIDQRGEVGLLSRNIVVQGDESSVASRFGAHIMVMTGSKGRFSNIEVTRAGQLGERGRYPIHFHLMGDTGAGSYVKGSSIHDTFQRWITIHGSNDLLIERNVAYDTFGHGYFFEDGVEVRNTVRGNLGILVRPIPEDKLLVPDLDEFGPEVQRAPDLTPAVFWMSNPNNTIDDNAAAGSTDGFGYWYVLTSAPLGASKDVPYKPNEAPWGSFKGNTAHTMYTVGCKHDYCANGVGLWVQGQEWTATRAIIQNFTSYNVSHWAYAVRNGKLTGARFAGQATGVFGHSNVVEDSLISATSLSEGDAPSEFGWRWGVHLNFEGVGENSSRRVTFANFNRGDNWATYSYNSVNPSPIGLNPSWVEKITLINSRAVYVEPKNPIAKESYTTMLLIDRDGSLSGTGQPQYIVFRHPFQLSPQCVAKDDWRAAVCPPKAASISTRNPYNGQSTDEMIRRDDGVVSGPSAGRDWLSLMFVLPDRTYTIQGAAVPSGWAFVASGITRTDGFKVEVPFAASGARVQVNGKALDEVASAAALDSAPGAAFFHDKARQMVVLKFNFGDVRADVDKGVEGNDQSFEFKTEIFAK